MTEMQPARFCARDHCLPLARTYIMGILNVTPDSFSDGGQFLQPEKALAHGLAMEADGADVLDMGGQSTRPGYEAVSPEEEWGRLGAVLPGILGRTRLPVSVDTFYPQVAEKALAAGAHIINDVSGFGDGMLQAVAGSGCGCVVMFPGGGEGGDVCLAARRFFEQRLNRAVQLGIAPERLCFDPGIGFGKTMEENLRLIARVQDCKLPGIAFLMAASRKRVTGAYCGNPPFPQRLPATIAAHTAAILGGADMIRVHDVGESVQAARMADALRAGRLGEGA